MGAGFTDSLAIRIDVLGVSIFLNVMINRELLRPQNLNLRDAEIIYYPSFYNKEVADSYYQQLRDETAWQQDDIKIFGKVYPQPRLTAFFGEPDKNYTYSGITMEPLPFTGLLKKIKTDVESITGTVFNSVLLNLYRNGKDSNGWHSDDEPTLGKNPVIASLSLGAERKFQLRHKSDKTAKSAINLEHGSLLLMKGETQHFWQHQVPKTKKQVDPRINLTFRVLN